MRSMSDTSTDMDLTPPEIQNTAKSVIRNLLPIKSRGHGRFNYLAVFANGFILLYATVECLGLGYVLNKADCDLRVTTGERGAISAATFIGVLAPAIIWGYLGDKLGRRRVMLPATVLAVVFSTLSSFSTNFMMMFFLRIITGALVSASCATAYVYLGELSSPSKRPAVIAWGSAFTAGSYLVMPVFAWILLPLNFSVHVGSLKLVSWRVLMWSYTISGTAACVCMAMLPESPSYVLSTKGGPATLEVLAKIYAWNKKKTVDEYPIKEIDCPPINNPTFKESLSRMKYMMKPPLLRCVLISHTCNFMVYMQSNSFYVWFPHIVDELLFFGAKRPTHGMCRIMNAVHDNVQLVLDECVPTDIDPRLYPIATVVGIITGGMYAGIAFGIKRSWRKATMYCAIMSTCAMFIILAAFVPNATASIVLLVPGVCGIAANSVVAAAVVEVFPTSLRALSMCTFFMVGRLGAAVGSNGLAWGLESNCPAIVLIITILTSVSGVLLFLWPDNEKTRAAMMAQDFKY